ncbi:MAG: polysaccharide pyruvyl transferase family protein [Clostridia bacterium]|nr:polysaccharide pyruvyl transferase family protein [Clostridia bacterium]
MKKVGIITIQSIVNYGNRLQNYAVQTLVQERGFECESIRLSDEKLWFKIYFKAFFLGRFLGKKSAITSKRTRKIIAFNKKYMNIKVLHKSNVKKYVEGNYDYLILGGDQLWASGNSDYGIPGYRFGNLIDKSKRIPFGVSFGGKVSEEYKGKISGYLNELEYLQIREQSGVEIIKEITGKDAELLLDPVFGLDVSDWDKLAISNIYIGHDYALTFFLGGSDAERNKNICDIAKECVIKNMNDVGDSSFTSGPEEFISYIKNAKIVFTDSFHCAAFAIIYNKPFVVFNRLNWDPSQMTRLHNLFDVLKTGDRLYREGDIDWFDIDYTVCNDILKKERERIGLYLDRCLKNVTYNEG